MNLKNVSIYTGLLLVVVIFGLLLEITVIDLRNSPYVKFSEASENYVDYLISGINKNNLKNVTEKTQAGYQEDSMYLAGEDEGGSSVTDFLANLNFFKAIQEKIINPLKFIYHVPAFLLSLFGLPLTPFSIFANVLNLVFYIGIAHMIITNLK